MVKEVAKLICLLYLVVTAPATSFSFESDFIVGITSHIIKNKLFFNVEQLVSVHHFLVTQKYGNIIPSSMFLQL